MSLGPPGAQLAPEQADNFEDIEKQFAVKGANLIPLHLPGSDR